MAFARDAARAQDAISCSQQTTPFSLTYSGGLCNWPLSDLALDDQLSTSFQFIILHMTPKLPVDKLSPPIEETCRIRYDDSSM